MAAEKRLTLSDGTVLSRQEEYVLTRVAAGERADLKEEFGEAEEVRRLRARFLVELLTGDLSGGKFQCHGVRIGQAVVEDPLDLEDAEVRATVDLNGCDFKDAVSFRDACFKRHLNLLGSHFFKAADFHRMKVGIGFFCQGTVFEGPLNLGAAFIGGQFAAVGARFLAQEGANFNALRVGQNAVLAGCQFHGPVDFGGAEIARQFTAEGAKFLAGGDRRASFNHLRVGHSARFDKAEFHGPVDFAGARSNGDFVARGAKFLAPDQKVNFSRLQVGQDAFFQGCDFHGVTDFILMKVAGNLYLDPWLKTGPEMAATFRRGVNLRGADIGGALLADKAQFLGLANFEAVKVGRSFHASGAIFGAAVYFTEMVVKNSFYIDPFGRSRLAKTLFKGPANFSRLEVSGSLDADQAIFQSENVIFSGLKVGQGAFFNGTIFFGGLVLKEGEVTDLVVRGLHRLSKGGLPLTEIVLNRTTVAHRLTIEDIEVKRFEARNLEVKGPTELRKICIREEADLRDAACHHLQMVEIDWPPAVKHQEPQARLFLDGLAYESITTRTGPEQAEKWAELLEWLGLSRFNIQDYQNLDSYLQRGGLRRWADKVFLAGKHRELGMKKRWQPTYWLTLLFWGLLAGYGRKPGRIFWPALALVLLGWGLVLYYPVPLEPNHWLAVFQGKHPVWTGLAISLDRFLPGVDLGVARVAQPAAASLWFWLFWHLEKLLGWVLTPILLAAIYTRMKSS